MKNAVAAQITESYQLLESYRNLLARLRHDPPAELYDLLHVGAEMAESLLGLVRDAHSRGIVGTATLKVTMELANAWLAFDDEVAEVLAGDLPAEERRVPFQQVPN